MDFFVRRAKVIVDWYMAIRSAKLNLLHVAHPNANQSELCQWLTHDFLKEGSLLKTGPKSGDAFKRRWFILDGRKLMYHEQCLVSHDSRPDRCQYSTGCTSLLQDAHPKGEIFVGHQSDGYSVFVGAPAGWKMKEQVGSSTTSITTSDAEYLDLFMSSPSSSSGDLSTPNPLPIHSLHRYIAKIHT